MNDPVDSAGAVILIYASDRSVREAIRFAIGRQVAVDLPQVAIVEAATQPAVMSALDAGGIDLAIFDGEASPSGGLGLCRQSKDEVADCPPVVVLVGRPQDAWLATWSLADAVVTRPIDPVALPQIVAEQLRSARTAAATG